MSEPTDMPMTNKPLGIRYWRTGMPMHNKPVEIWYWNTVLLAYYDGYVWRTLDSQHMLDGVTHWRERNA